MHGVLIQYPIPAHLDYDAALQTLDPDKDVDGMHPLNMGRLAVGLPGPLPCTPAGIEALLAHHGIPVAGREVVILGRGATLGRPLAMLLAQKRPTANAAVTVVHTGVADWPRYTRRADILIAAAGVPGIIQPEHVKPGAVVVGAGVRYEGRRLLPDVDESLRRGGRRDHPAGRRRRPHHDRDALPQRGRRGRTRRRTCSRTRSRGLRRVTAAPRTPRAGSSGSSRRPAARPAPSPATGRSRTSRASAAGSQAT